MPPRDDNSEDIKSWVENRKLIADTMERMAKEIESLHGKIDVIQREVLTFKTIASTSAKFWAGIVGFFTIAFQIGMAIWKK